MSVVFPSALQLITQIIRPLLCRGPLMFLMSQFILCLSQYSKPQVLCFKFFVELPVKAMNFDLGGNR